MNSPSGADFSVYRCPDPRKVKTGEPWYPISNVCPCDPQFGNISGRGFTPCAFGITTNQQEIVSAVRSPPKPPGGLPTGSLFQTGQFSPPQLDPRQNVRIENQWRNAF